MNPTALDAARCAVHPESLAVGNCTRCGAFSCVDDAKLIFGKLFCTTCANRPDVNYLEALRLKYWGKRDSWRWFYGFGVLSYLGSLSYFVFILRDLLGTALGGAGVGICFAYFLGQRWARYAIVALQCSFIGLGLALERYELAIVGVSGFVVSLAALNDTRNQLAFQVSVSERKLHQYWDRFVNNTAARTGATLGAASLIIPVFAPLALGFSVVGLRRVDPNAIPPIGKKWHALFGIALSVISIVGWGSVLLRSRL